MNESEIQAVVRDVIAAVGSHGDEALVEFTARWDGAQLGPDELRVPAAVIDAADVETPFAKAFRRAAERIQRFHEKVKPESRWVEDTDGARMGMRWTPISSVGLYVPGGKASYPSTLAMTAVPARVAGVERIVVVSPPGPDGEVSGLVLMAAKILGLTEIYRIGGAQAVAALALGTKRVPRVAKIFGPGNTFVTEAKKQLYGTVGIDVLAGPSELVVYAGPGGDPEAAAADLIAQAEHDESTRVTLLASSRSVLERTRAAVERLTAAAPRREIIEKALSGGARFEVVASDAEAAERINEIAPEHLSIQVEDPWRVLLLVKNAGAIYLGRNSPVAAGDYYAGPNHVLPTGGAARYASCLSVEDFMKRSNVVETTREFLRRKGEDIERLAEGEGLAAHALSVAVRRRPRTQARAGVHGVPPYRLVEEGADVKVNQNESPWDVPLEVKDAVAARLRELPWNRYPQKIPDEFLERLAREAGVSGDSILAASGSNLILQWIFSAFCPPESRILAPAPSFALYGLWGDVVEANLVEVPLTASLEYDADAVAEGIRREKPAVAVLCLPNNPTGSEMPSPEVRRIAEEAVRHGTVLVVDEAYREFTEPEFDRTWLAREYPNAILLRTFSKAYAAAGLRLGYLLGSPGLVADLRKMVPPFHLSVFTAVFGLAALDARRVFLDRVKEILSERSRLMEGLSGVGGLEVLPTHANFFLIRVADSQRLFDGLKQKGILVRAPVAHAALEGCLRVNVGTPEENDKLVTAIEELLAAN